MANIQLTENLRILRERSNLKQDEFSRYLNISSKAFYNYERCPRPPDLELLKSIADFYHITIDELLFCNGYKIPLYSMQPDRISEGEIPYIKCKKSDNIIYLTDEELKLLLLFRAASDEVRQIITGFLANSNNQEE